MKFIKQQQTISGGEICYYHTEDIAAAKKVFIMLSGWGTPSTLLDVYNLATQLCSAETGIIIIERFGQGKSANTKRERSFDNFVEETNDVITHVDIEQKEIILIGHSLGGFIAFECLKKLDYIHKVILLDAVPITNIILKKSYYFNFLYAHCMKSRINNKHLINEKLLLSTLSITDTENIPNEIIDDALVYCNTNLYNENTLAELTSMIKKLDTVYDNIETIVNKEIVSIVRKNTYKLSVKMKKHLAANGINMTIVNIGESSHYLHNEHNEMVANICLDSEFSRNK